MGVQTYHKPKSLTEAADLLAADKTSAIIGGGAFLRLGARTFETAIDLFDAGLDYIRETDAGLEVGAMTTYRMLETDSRVLAYADGVIAKAVDRIVGVQMRNIVTVGGTVFGRYAFSNLTTALLALDADVVLHKAGRLPLSEFMSRKPDRGDILGAIVLPREGGRAAWQDLSRTRNDYAVLNVCVAGRDEPRVVVGARPGVARLCPDAAAAVAAGGDDAPARAGAAASAELDFGDDLRASADYRRRLCRVLVERAVQEVLS
jgi:CO/xanthine dehydrogenase FAD-binding subunit